MKNKPMNEFALLSEKEGVPLFYPHIPKNAFDEVKDTLSGRWIGQGPKVDKFEQDFKLKFLGEHEPLAVGSGTDALHLAYLLAGVKTDDEVIVPVFTCTATNIPLLYIGAKPVFADIDPETMNICVKDVESKITPKTKAISCVDYGGVPCDYDYLNMLCKKYNLKLISDAAHSIGAKYKGKFAAQHADFTIFSFQAIKTLTMGDGGLLAIKDKSLLEKGKRLRWFGIDRAAKQGGIWENDITEIGFKYQMNDIAAAIGLAGLEQIDKVINHRNNLLDLYSKNINSSNCNIVGAPNSDEYFNPAWLVTIIVKDGRIRLMEKLRKNNIESAQCHYRNDRYSIFDGRRSDLKNMDDIEDNYIVLPNHTSVTEKNVLEICSIINEGW